MGKADLAYYEMDFHEWDVCAGQLLCREAGLAVRRSPPATDASSPRLLAGVPELVERVAPSLMS